MLTIAGGILLAVVLIVTIGIWLPLLFYLIVIVLVLGIAVLIIGLAIENPEYPIAIFVMLCGFWAIAGIFKWWERKRSKRLERKRRKRQQIIQTKLDEEDTSVFPGEAKKYLMGSDEDDSNFKGDEEGEDESDIKGLTLLEKVEKVKEEEKARLIKEKEKGEERERKIKEIQAEKFAEIKPYLQELKLSYASDKDIHIVFLESRAFLLLKHFGSTKNEYEKDNWTIIIMIEAKGLGDSYLVRTLENIFVFHEALKWDDSMWEDYWYAEGEHDYFNSSNELMDYITEKVGKFLAERESS